MSRVPSRGASSRADPAHDLTSAPPRALDTSASEQRSLDFYHLLTVFSVAAAMVGVCLTAIGLVQIIQSVAQVATVCDTLLVGDAVLFLAAMVCSFVSMRLRFRGPWRRLAVAADVSIVAGLVLMVVCCGVLVWSLL